MSSLAERIANIAISTFDQLPQRCKPRVDTNGKKEWTPMSAVIISQVSETPSTLKCISLATGTKCLPSSAIKKCNGMVLHDCHAEILAFRGFNQWLLIEIQALLEDPEYESNYVERRPDTQALSRSTNQTPTQPPFRIKPNTQIYLFTTTAPCGDASMDLLMSSKPSSESIPWTILPPPAISSSTSSFPNTNTKLQNPLGRGHFSLLGTMRRKPARADAESTLSKSCTDKIALKQFTSLLSFPTDLLVAPTEETYLKGMVVYSNEYHEVGYTRAFGREGRLSKMLHDDGHDDTKPKGRFFETMILPEDYKPFEFGKRSGSKATNLAALWITGLEDDEGQSATLEVLVGGVKQGFKQWDVREGKMSVVCRRRLAEKVVNIFRLLCDAGYSSVMEDWGEVSLEPMKFSHLKCLESRSERKVIKSRFIDRLGGWISNTQEDDFLVRMLTSVQTDKQIY